VISKLQPSGLLKGVRHLFSWEEREDWFTRDDVGVGLDILGKHNIPYDLQARYELLTLTTCQTARENLAMAHLTEIILCCFFD
jgi:hypothetical protein